MTPGMNLTLTGATGFIGTKLIARLVRDGNALRVLARRTPPDLPSGARFAAWDANAGEPPADALEGADAVIHLAGEPVAQRWIPETKRRIRASRVDGTRHLVHALSTLSRRPATLIVASAIGIYGDRGNEILTEASEPGSGFLPETCVEWEQAASLAEALGMRVVRLRIGIVLGLGGGALARMLPPFKLGIGGRLSSGGQWMSWIHVEDLVELLCFAATASKLTGAVNATAPNPVTNTEFTRVLARVLRRPALFPVPKLALKLLFGEMSRILLESQRVLPKAAEAAGFRFRRPDLRAALEELLA